MYVYMCMDCICLVSSQIAKYSYLPENKKAAFFETALLDLNMTNINIRAEL